MADYQEYRRRILHRRWRRVFIIVALLALLALLTPSASCEGAAPGARGYRLSQNTILRQVTTDNTWNTINYPLGPAAAGADTGGQHRDRAGLPHGGAAGQCPGGKKLVCTGQLCGRQPDAGLQIYDTGLPGAQFCAIRGSPTPLSTVPAASGRTA